MGARELPPQELTRLSRALDRPPVRGAGGGKGGGGGGGEAADTLRSTQLADVVDLLGEGEFEGLTNGLQSIYYDGVPLQNADGTFNFQNVQVWFTPGTQGQASITGADGVQTETGVGVDVVQATPVVRTITNPAVDKVRVTIAVPQLSDTNTSNGYVGGSSFEWAIDVQSAGGGYVQLMQENVSGKVSSSYTRSKVLTLPGSAPWDVRVRRITGDSASAYTVNKFAWSTYTEIQSVRLRHPNSAMVRHRIDARQFSRIPVRSFDVMGARVQVPNNYDPKTKTYTGIWNGGFKIAWTDCPAWVYYALASNPRYGLGRYFPIGDGVKWDLYRIGQYCDQMVSDGRGGVEPRFRCGVQLTTREQAYKVLTDMAGIFRGMGYWMNSDVAVVQDAPSDPVAVFTPANVVGGKFSYAGASHSKRHTQVTVWFNDLAQGGKLVPEVVVDAALERRMGVRPLELSPLGCWSRGQAHRLAKWALYSEQYEGGTINFRVGMDGVLVPPGKVFEVADPNEAGERLGGRVHSATASVVTLDATVTLAAGESYLLSVMVQDPADPAKLVRQQRAVTTPAGDALALTVVPAFSSAPAAESVWVLQSDAVQATTWRCLALGEVDGSNDYEISALRHYPQKYELIENGVAFALPSVSRISSRAAKPTGLTLTETVYITGTATRSRATFSWHAPAPGLSYLVSWRLANGPWTDVPATSSNTVEMDNLVPGLLEASVRSVNAIGNTSPAVAASLTLLGDAGASVRLTASVPAFVFDAAAVAKPAGQTITLTAQRVNLAGVAVITATGYAANGSGATALVLGGAGEVRTLTVADFGSFAYARVVATLDGHTGEVYIGRVGDGLAGASAPWVRITGDNYNVNLAGYGGRGLLFANGQTTGTVSNGMHLVVYDLATETIVSGPTPFHTYAVGTAALVAAIAAVPAGRVLFLYSYDADMCDAALRAQLVMFGGTPGLTWAPLRRSHVFIGMRDWLPGEGYEAFSDSTGPDGVISIQAYYSATGLVKNGAAGTPGTNGLSNALVYIYQRGSSTPALPSATSTYTFATAALTGLNNGWSATIPGGTGTLYASVATASAAGASDTIAAAEWAAAQVMAQDGAAGATAASVFIYQRGTSAPALPSATTTFTFATGALTGLNNGWSASIPTGTDPIYASTATAFASGGSDTIGASEWAAVQLLAQSGANGSNGTNGTNGSNGTNGQSSALVHIYQRSTTSPTLPSATATFTFATGGISGLNNGWVATPPGGTDPLYLSVATASAAGLTDTITAGEWASPVVLAQNGGAGLNGADGINNATVFLFQRTTTPTAPALPSATVTYTFATAVATGINNGWTQALPATGGAYRWVTTATALSSTSTDTIGASEWAPASLQAQDGNPGTNGTNAVSSYTATVYAQASSTPGAPTGGSYNVSTTSLVAPSGWSTTIPATSSTLYTYAATYTFTTSTPSTTVTGGTWGGIAAIAGGPTTGPIGFTNEVTAAFTFGSGTGTPSPARASVRLNRDGTVETQSSNGGSTSWNTAGYWHSAPSSTVGDNYQVRAVVAGDALGLGSANTNYQLNATRSFGLVNSGVRFQLVEKDANVTLAILDMAGNVLVSDYVHLFASMDRQ